MNIICHQNPFIDSVFHISAKEYQEHLDIHFVGAPSVHEHIILNDKCAILSFEIDGEIYEFDSDMICGKFTHAPKIKIIFKNTCQKLTIIRVNSCGMFRLTDQPIESMVNKVLSSSLINIDANVDIQNYIDSIDAYTNAEVYDTPYMLTREMVKYLNANFLNLPRNASTHMADYFNLSESTLRRYFKKYIGMTLSTYIITLKRKKMIQTLFEDNYDSLSVQENGYYDQSHFLNDFKRLYGVPLKQYFNNIQTLKNDAPDLMRFLYHCNIESAV